MQSGRNRRIVRRPVLSRSAVCVRSGSDEIVGGFDGASAFFIESVPALFVGCLLTNLGGLGVYDIIIGSLTTLLAAICTYFTGKLIKNKYLKFFIGILFPIIFNAFAVPWVFLLSGVEIQGYFIETLIIGAGELGAVGIFGGILYFSTYRLFAPKGDDKT